METFESTWPTSFHQPLTKNVTTMQAAKKSMNSDGGLVYDTELIYTRVLGLQQSRDLDIKNILKHELSPVPQALFDEHGDMRSQAKVALKNKLKVELSSRYASHPDTFIIDGCAFLWSGHWPAQGTVENYITNFMENLKFYLQRANVYLVFDKYPPGSIKGVTKSNRAGNEASWKHVLTLQTPLSPQKVV